MTDPFDRTTALDRLGRRDFDVLVIGGGITGAGVALDAAARGLRVALVEKADFASGTSSRSSKLVHGGLRYLTHLEFGLVRQALRERARLLRNAPHLVRTIPFLLATPRLDDGKAPSALLLSAALWAYDLTGSIVAGRHRKVDTGEVLEAMPSLDPERLVSTYMYTDAQVDDARLTLEIIRTAAIEYGAVAVNHCGVARLLADGGRTVGAELDDGTEVRARVVVNAAGVWAGEVDALDARGTSIELRPAKGIHLAVPFDRLPNTTAALIPSATSQAALVVPWGSHTYVGTTDTAYDGPLDDPSCTADDIAELLGLLNVALRVPVSPEEITGCWAGLRPLVAGNASTTSDLSRHHIVKTSETGVVTVTGGKLTTYRAMAQDTVDEIVRLVGRGDARSPTASLAIRGATGWESVDDPRLARRYGGEADAVLELVAVDPSLAEPLVPGLPYLRAEAVFAVRDEMAHTLGDVLIRRTRALFLDTAATVAAAPAVAALVAPELGWDDAEVDRQLSRFERVAASHRLPALR